MATVTVAPALARWLPGRSPGTSLTVPCSAGVLRDVLNELFDLHPALRGYVLDEHGRIRHHVVVFVDNQAVTDKETLSAHVGEQGEVYIFQALSGG